MQCKDDLQETVVSKEYKQWVSKPKYVKLGLQLSTVILSQTFWDNVKKVVDMCIPVVDVLRLADGHVPCTGKIYWKMFQAHKSIEESVELGDNDRNLLASLIMKRWTVLHTDLHAAGFVLDPEFQQFLQHENQEVINGFYAMIERVFPDNVELQVKVIEQHSSYRTGHGLSADQWLWQQRNLCLLIDGGLRSVLALQSTAGCNSSSITDCVSFSM